MSDIPAVDELALTAWGEARGEPLEGRIAVGCVVRNRLATKRWGTDYASVVHAPGQFSCWWANGGAANYATLQRFRARVEAEGGALIDDPLWQETRWAAQGILDDVVLDRVKGSTHYFESALPVVPFWAKGKTPVCRIGGHVFFAGIL